MKRSSQFNKAKKSKESKNVEKTLNIIGEGHLPDIMNLANESVKVEKYNNIIYYDSNPINQDYYLFQKATDGAFILCTNIDSLKMVINEIIRYIKISKSFIFNLIIKGNESNIIMNFFKGNKEFDDCINNICILCENCDKFKSLQNKYKKVYGVYTKVEEVIEFIKLFSSKEIKPYPIKKVITYDDYKEK